MRRIFDEVTSADQRSRDAAIAAMGQRLAAAGPRTRQRVTQRQVVADERPVDAPPEQPRSPVLVAHRSQAFIRDVAPVVPPNPRWRALTAIGRAVAIAGMASAGFAVVLLAQSPRWSAAHRPAPKRAMTPEIAQDQPPPALPDAAQPAIQPAQLAEPAASVPAPLLAPAPQNLPAAHGAPADQPAPAVRAIANPPTAEPPMPVPKPAAVPRPVRHLQVQLASLARLRPISPRPVQAIARHPARLAHYTLPRWLTDARDTTARPIVMSPPPHDLEAPVGLASRTIKSPPLASAEPVERHHLALPPIPRARLIYASAGYAAPPLPNRGASPYAGYDGPAYPPLPYGYQQAQPYAP
jgi:hypothetical protein